MNRLLLVLLVALVGFGAASGCFHQTVSPARYYQHPGVAPWYYHGGYIELGQHVLSEQELLKLKQFEAESGRLPEPPPDTPDMGLGEMEPGDYELDF